MVLLAFDTSTRQASVALCSEEKLFGEYTWQIGNNHSVELLDHIQRLLLECHVSMQQLDAVAVAIGPGSFNGVRVALATAKTLSFALQKPLVGVCTLDAIAAQHQQWYGPVCAILEAGRSEIYAACYLFEHTREEDGTLNYHMRQLSEYMLLAPQQVAEYIHGHVNTWVGVPGERELPPALFCGEISVASHQILQAQLQAKSLFVHDVQATRRASTLALLALQRLHKGEQDDPLLLEPLYLRRPSITTSKRKQPLLGGKSQRPITGQSLTEREEGALRH